MKTIGVATISILACIVVCRSEALSQMGKIQWQCFSGGFGSSATSSIRVQSIVAQSFADVSTSATTQVSSGFLFGMARILGVEGDRQTDIPERYALDQNYPNPFNPSTTIQFELPRRSVVSLKVYDILGRNVLTLVDGPMDAGRHRVELNSSVMASGAYFYRLETEGFVRTMKLLVIK